jgi:HEAT repeat protein
MVLALQGVWSMRLARQVLFPLVFLFALGLPGNLVAQQPASPPLPPSDEQVLKNANLRTDASSLLDFFRNRTAPETDPAQIAKLVEQLNDQDNNVRDRAAAALVSFGPGVLPLLRQAANDLDNLDLATRAREVLQALEGGPALAVSAARLLGQAKPAGSAEVLLAYLPFVEDDLVADEVTRALRAVAVRDGKPEPALMQALQDKVPLRRAVAAEVLCRAGGPQERATVRQLLQDPRTNVRLRAALALSEARDAEAVGVLIALLEELSPDQARQVEDFLRDLGGEWSVTTPQGSDEIARRMRREIWASWWHAADGSALLNELRQRTLDDAGHQKALTLIFSLTDPAPEARDQAQAALLAMGSAVVPLVRQAAGSTDAKVSEAAQKCLQLFLDKGTVAPLPSAAPRLIALRKPPGAVEALLAYLPYAEEETALEVQAALTALALRDGKLEPAVALALADKLPVRRAAAAEVVCQVALGDYRSNLFGLLNDPDPMVRCRTGLALAAAREKEAVPVLIALLTELPTPQATQVEDYLRLVAGDKAPEVQLDGDKATRQKCRDTWAAWWRDHGSAIELAQLDIGQRQLGYTLIVIQFDPTRSGGRVFEIDAAGKTRWSIDGLQAPVEAQVLPGDRVLLVENWQRVTERDTKGKVLWEKPFTGVQVIGAQRLPNGNTFIALRNQLLELDRTGKEVFTHQRPNGDIMAAQRLRDGQYVFLTNTWHFIRLDANGKEQKSIRVGNFPFQVNPNAVDFLPNDRLLVAQFNLSKVTEIDVTGRILWETSVPMPLSVSRLANGNTLVVSSVPQNNLQRVAEVDRYGKTVWEYKENVRPWRARRR